MECTPGLENPLEMLAALADAMKIHSRKIIKPKRTVLSSNRLTSLLLYAFLFQRAALLSPSITVYSKEQLRSEGPYRARNNFAEDHRRGFKGECLLFARRRSSDSACPQRRVLRIGPRGRAHLEITGTTQVGG